MTEQATGSPAAKSGPPRAAINAIAVLTLLLLVAAAVLAWRKLDALGQPINRQTVTTNTYTPPGGRGDDQPAPHQQLMRGPMTVEQLLQQPGAEPMAREPLDLPIMDEAREGRRVGVRMQVDGRTVRHVQWTIPGVTPDAALQHYREALIARGFEKQQDAIETDHNELFHRRREKTSTVVIVNAAEWNGRVRVWLSVEDYPR